MEHVQGVEVKEKFEHDGEVENKEDKESSEKNLEEPTSSDIDDDRSSKDGLLDAPVTKEAEQQ